MAKEPVARSFEANTRPFFSERVEYDTAHCLLIKWSENDFEGELGTRFTNEFSKIQRLFEQDLKITTEVFDISVDEQRAQQGLFLELANFVSKHSNHARTLIIIYYAGHGDRDSHGKAQWMSREENGTVLSWAAASQVLLGAAGDVLVLLDCCHAALYEGTEKLEGKFEVLAATTKGQLAILPGKLSFTSQLVEQIKVRARSKSSVIVRDIHKSLMKIAPASVHDFPNPHYTDLVKGGAESINLRSFKRIEHPEFRKRTSGSITLRATLDGDLTEQQLKRWLQSYCPESVTSVKIPEMIVRARSLQQIGAGLTGQTIHTPILDQIPESAKTEVLEKIHDLNIAMSKSSDAARNDTTSKDARTAMQSLAHLSESVTAASRAIETPLLLENESSCVIETHDLLQTIGAVTSTSLRRQSFSGGLSKDEMEINRNNIEIAKSDKDSGQRFREGRINKQVVLVEAFAYHPDPETAEPFQQTVRQVRKMATLLRQEKEGFYHILPGVGYVRESLHDRIGLVFAIPDELTIGEGPLLLSELFAHPLFRRVALGERLKLAREIVTAVEHLHRIQWLHKELRSNNILFLRNRDDPSQINLGFPWLCGFEYARNTDEGTNLEEDHALQNNLYRSPDRWGKPLKTFVRSHDMYSLGVILLEIFIWQSAESIYKKQNTNAGKPNQHSTPRVNSVAVKARYLEKSRQDLPHLVGHSIANVVENCLEFEERTVGMSEYQTQLFLQKEILDKVVAATKQF